MNMIYVQYFLYCVCNHRPPCMFIIVDHLACINIMIMLTVVDHRACIITHVTSTCLRLLVITHALISLMPPYVSICRRRPRYMLTIVDHYYCRSSRMHRCRHLLSYTVIHAYVCRSSCMYHFPCHLHM